MPSNDEGIPTAAQFLLIIGTYTFWTQLHGIQLQVFISHLIQAYGPRALAYLADRKIMSPENEDIRHLYRQCDIFLQRNGYSQEPLSLGARVDIMHGLAYIMFIGPSMLTVQIITNLDWRCYQLLLQHWLTEVYPNGNTNWEDHSTQVKHLISMVIEILSHRTRLYKSCKQMLYNFPLAMIGHLPIEIRDQFSLMTDHPNEHLLQTISRGDVEDTSSDSESENISSPTHSSMPGLEFCPLEFSSW